MVQSMGALRPIREVGLVLVPGFSLLAMSSALEPLRMANQLSGRSLYATRLLSAAGSFIAASSGVTFHTAPIDNVSRLDLVLICAGLEVQEHCDRRLLGWLRVMAARRTRLGAVCTGGYVLAKAGVLDGHRCTLHWENISSINEALLFPRVVFTSELFVLDRDRFTSSGGVAPLDMMLTLIARQHGTRLAEDIAEEFLHERIRDDSDRQRMPLRVRLGTAPPRLAEAITLMEANLREPLPLTDLAAYAGLSRRQLERLFQSYLECSPSRYYLQLRLDRARQLLRQTQMPIADIAAACGFVSAPHFTRCYRNQYLRSPSQDRRGRRDAHWLEGSDRERCDVTHTVTIDQTEKALLPAGDTDLT